MSRLKPPISYYGGKGYLVHALLPLLPEHATYVETHGGSAALLFAKPPAPVEVYNDIDEGLVGFYRVLRDPERFEELRRLCALTPYSRSEYNEARRTWRAETDPVRRAWKWFTVARMSFSGSVNWSSWSYTVVESRRDMSSSVMKWLASIDRLPQAHARLRTVQVECDDWRALLARFDRPDTLFFVDPPYIHSSRGRHRYRYEMSDADHGELTARLLELEGMVLLCGYRVAWAHAPLEESGWRRLELETVCHASQHKRAEPRTECVWLNERAQVRVPRQLLLAGGVG